MNLLLLNLDRQQALVGLVVQVGQVDHQLHRYREDHQLLVVQLDLVLVPIEKC